jgi:Domain of unknown function (DUF1835)
MLHVTNGDSVAGTLAETGLEGRILPWRDVLHAGPVPVLAPAELRGLRAEFLAARGWAERAAAEADMRERDETLAAALGAEPVVLWFEHDLYDQLQLIQILARVPAGADLQAILVDRFLGELAAEELAALWPARRPVSPAALAAARAAWDAFTAPDPALLAGFTDGALPHLDAAFARLREEYPATTDGLARSERQLLSAIGAGAETPVSVFLAAQRAEAAPYCGDAQVFDMLDELAAAPEPLLEREPLRLTEAGCAVLAGAADRVALRGVDRWLGGVHVDGTWRWDVEQLRLTALN